MACGQSPAGADAVGLTGASGWFDTKSESPEQCQRR